MISRAVVRTLSPSDPTLGAVVQALRSPADGEEAWIASIEAARSRLHQSDRELRYRVGDREWWEQLIAASSDPSPPVLHEDYVACSVAGVARASSKSRDWGRFLYRIVRELRPERCLELGTSVGMSGSYIAAGLVANSLGRLITLEGQEHAARVAREVFEDVGVDGRVESRVGQFAEVMPEALSDLGGIDLAFIDGDHEYAPTMRYFATILRHTASGGLLMFDDVIYTRGMKAAWGEIRAHDAVTGSLTVGPVGFAVVGGGRVKHRRVPVLTVPA